MFTRLMDMHSGGDQKLEHDIYFIEADEETAVRVFMERFGRDPYNVTCPCCGPDYSVWECDEPVDDYAENPLVITKDQL